jgi:predicted dithiol-disulfide oxidoreductase (DUF899 family)
MIVFADQWRASRIALLDRVPRGRDEAGLGFTKWVRRNDEYAKI